MNPGVTILVVFLSGSFPDVADDVEVIVKTVHQDVVRGRLSTLSLSDGAVLRTEMDDEYYIPNADLVRMTAPTLTPPDPVEGWTFHLRNGDYLIGRVVSGTADTVEIEVSGIGLISVPMDVLTRIDTPLASKSSFRQSLLWLDRQQDSNQDRILLQNGDVLRGFIQAIGDDGIMLDGVAGQAPVQERLIVAVRFSPSRIGQVTGPYVIITLKGGGKVSAADLRWDGRKLDARLAWGPRVSVHPDRVAEMEFNGGRWEWLSSHQPVSFEHTPMLALPWEVALNKNVRGGPIRVGGESFARGIGVHSRASLSYELHGQYREFVTSLGIDDDSGPHADVSVFILVDGHRRFAQAHVRKGELHGPLRLDVRGAERIELVVDFGDNGDLQDRFNWVEAALVRD